MKPMPEYMDKTNVMINGKTAYMFAVICALLTIWFGAMTQAHAVEIVSVSDDVVNMEVRRGKLLRLDKPAATVFVADPSIADIQVKSPKLIYVFAKQPGETTLFAVDSRENVLANIDVRVSHNLSRLQDGIDQLFPDSGVRATSMDATIVLDGTVSSASTVEDIRRLAVEFSGAPEKVITRIGVSAPNQVNLRVRVAEVSRDIDKQIGFNWNLASTGSLALGLMTANPLAATLTQNTFSIGGAIGAFDINAVMDALEDEGMITVLAEPNLTAMSGETASFLAGGEFPILVPDSDGKVTIEFKKFGISLAFTPTLVGTDRINLHVNPEVSQLSTTNAVTLSGFQVPSLTTRRAETTVELGSGQSFAIAGLIQNNSTHSISKFPGLGDIPVLGALFRSDRFQREETELVIIITPYLVKPTSSQKLAAPTDGFIAPNDSERLGSSYTNKRADQAGEPVTVDPQGKSLIGPVGFVVD